MRFVLIDRFVEIVPGDRAVAVKTFSAEDDFFSDHFPGFPVVPGSLIAEAMGQAGGWLIASGRGFRDWPLLNMIDGVKLRRFVRAGEEIRISAQIRSARDPNFEVAARASVGGHRVADGRFLYRVFSPETIGVDRDAKRLRDWTETVSKEIFGAVRGRGKIE